MGNRRQALKNLFLGGALTVIGIPGRVFANGSTEESKKNNLPGSGDKDRAYWIKLMYKMVYPVLSNLADGTLKKNMPLEKSSDYTKPVSTIYVEIVGRTYAGIAAWLALPDDATDEGELRKKLRGLALTGLKNAVDPSSPDCLQFRVDYQPIVDSAYLAQAFIRAPKVLWEPLDEVTKQRIITEFKALRVRKPFNTNWQLFGAITETFLLSIGEQYDEERIFGAVKKIQSWYVGDGWYSDGPMFSFDYYNSYVIHSMLVDTLKILSEHKLATVASYDLAVKRMQRYASQLERMISPEGTFPPIGRSITYRTGALQGLAQVALMEKLPEGIMPGQVRSAITTVARNMFSFNDIFDKNGWLQLGFCGHQPEIADYYTTTGSLYMATLGFLPLGLPVDNPFWTAPAEDWTAKKAWSGKSIKNDHHVEY
ncbi:DUF2264 domain-containing protein [Pedobacter borealis]|uniref:DUF2264 domain-containing protein n=1 Tax=Pedobacter borealis TaxID=475254 RepID=UPI0004935148|nr:DUF2264 domain-containing protein [Pedobacter borealis]